MAAFSPRLPFYSFWGTRQEECSTKSRGGSGLIPENLPQRRASRHRSRRHLEQPDADLHLLWREGWEVNPPADPIRPCVA